MEKDEDEVERFYSLTLNSKREKNKFKIDVPCGGGYEGGLFLYYIKD